MALLSRTTQWITKHLEPDSNVAQLCLDVRWCKQVFTLASAFLEINQEAWLAGDALRESIPRPHRRPQPTIAGQHLGTGRFEGTIAASWPRQQRGRRRRERRTAGQTMPCARLQNSWRGAGQAPATASPRLYANLLRLDQTISAAVVDRIAQLAPHAATRVGRWGSPLRQGACTVSGLCDGMYSTIAAGSSADDTSRSPLSTAHVSCRRRPAPLCDLVVWSAERPPW